MMLKQMFQGGGMAVSSPLSRTLSVSSFLEVWMTIWWPSICNV